MPSSVFSAISPFIVRVGFRLDISGRGGPKLGRRVRLVRTRPRVSAQRAESEPRDSRQHLAVIWMTPTTPPQPQPPPPSPAPFSQKMFYVITSEICCFSFAHQMPHRVFLFVVVVLFCPPPPLPVSSQVKKMSSSSRALFLALALALSVVEVAAAETLCGGELVDALQFVCEDRGFYFSTSPSPPATPPLFCF